MERACHRRLELLALTIAGLGIACPPTGDRSNGGGPQADAGAVAGKDAGLAGPAGAGPCAGLPDGASCDDGDATTFGDRCRNRVCRGERPSLSLEPAQGGAPSFVAPADRVVIQARVNVPELAPQIRWQVRARGPAGSPEVLSDRGAQLVFRARSQVDTRGSRSPNPPLEYEVSVRLPVTGAEPATPASVLRQDEEDVIRQEYVDHAMGFTPNRTQVVVPAREDFNTGNYTFIVEEQPGLLEDLLLRIEGKLNETLARKVRPPVRVNLEAWVSSAYRNPQRNVAVGSITKKSLHLRGRALDIDPRGQVAGVSDEDMMCYVEAAAKQVVGTAGKVITEQGASTILDCDSPSADHVHVNK